MKRSRRPTVTGVGLGLLFAIGPGATVVTNVLAQTAPAGAIDTSFGDNTQQPGRVLTDFRSLPDGRRSLDQVTATALQADGKIVAAGRSDSPNGDQNFALVRYNANGTPDTSFGDNTQQPGRVLTDFGGSTDEISAIALQPDGKIVAAGWSDSPNGDHNFALVRYNTNGTIDTTFGDNTQQPGRVLTDFRALPNGSRSADEIRAIILQPDGKIVAAGYSNSPNGDNNFALVRYQPNGVIDTTFGDNTQEPGRVLTDFRALPDGSRSVDEAHALVLQPDGKIVVGGSSTSPNGDLNFALIRYNTNGTIDTTFGDNTQQPGRVLTDFRGTADEISAIALQPDGKIVAAGRSSSPNGGGATGSPNPANPGDLGAQREAIIKLFRELAAELQFDLFPTDPPQPDGLWSWQLRAGRESRLPGRRRIIIEQFSSSELAADDLALFIGDERRRLKPEIATVEPARVGDHVGFLVTGAGYPPRLSPGIGAAVYLIWRCENLTMVCDVQVDPGPSVNREQVQQQFVADMQGLAARLDQKLAQAQVCQPSQPGDDNFALVRYHADGTIDTSFGDNTQQPGRVLTDFRALPDGARSNDRVHALVLQADGKIIVAGSSASPNGDHNFALVRYNTNGVIDTSFGDNTQQPGRVLTDFRALEDGRRSQDEAYALALQPDGKIVAAGSSASPNGDDNFAVVRYYGTPIAGPTPGTTPPPQPPAPTGQINLILSLGALQVKGGSAVTATVTLSSPAPAGGVALYLESFNPDVASVPGSLIIPAGASSGTFTITTRPVTAAAEAGIYVDFLDPTAPIVGDADFALLVVIP